MSREEDEDEFSAGAQGAGAYGGATIEHLVRGWIRMLARPAVSKLILLLLLSTAIAGSACAGTLAEAERAYARQNYVRAAEIFAPLSERGYPLAQTYLGIMYYRGQGVPQNFEVATHWLHVASKAGVPTAQYFLGLMYDKGQGVPQDFVLAHAWLNLAVAHAEPRLRSRWVLIRNAVASKMSEAQLFEARRLAYEWRPDP